MINDHYCYSKSWLIMDVLSFTKQKSVGSLLIVILNHMMIMKICFVYMYEFIKTKQNQHFQEFYQVYQKVPN